MKEYVDERMDGRMDECEDGLPKQCAEAEETYRKLGRDLSDEALI